MSIASALLHLESELGPNADADEFSAWCDHHHGEILRVPGFLRARRFVQLSPDTSALRLLTLYDLVDAAVLDGDAYAAHGRDHTPLPDALVAALTFTRSVWAASSPHSRTTAGHGLVWELSEPHAAVRPPIPRPHEVPGLAGVRRFVPAERGAGGISLTLLDVRSVDDLADAERARPVAGPGLTRRTYRQVFHSVA